MEWLQNMIDSVGVFITSLFTMLGEEYVIIAILGFLYWCYDKELGKLIGTNIIVGIVWNPLIKNIVLRRRPYFDHDNIKCLKPVDISSDIYDISAQGYSLPSGHSTNSAIIYWSLLNHKPQYEGTERSVKNRVLRVVLIILPILVGISRIILGVHYPTDVISGWLMGGFIALFLPKLQKKIARWKLHLAILTISLIGIFYSRTSDYFTALGIMIGFFLAIPFEERYVNFKGTDSPVRCILRLIGGFGLYFGVNAILKLPFNSAFLATPVLSAFIIRTIRYAVILFFVMGIYPMIFDKVPIISKLESSKSHRKYQ